MVDKKLSSVFRSSSASKKVEATRTFFIKDCKARASATIVSLTGAGPIEQTVCRRSEVHDGFRMGFPVVSACDLQKTRKT